MPISPYLKGLREKVGSQPLLTSGVDAIIYDEQGRLLLLKRSDNGYWGLTGGQLDPLEPPALGVIREVYEETGLKVVPTALLGLFGGIDAFHLCYPNGDEVHPIVALFRCRVVGGDLNNRDGEATEVQYFSPNALPPDLTPITGYVLEKLQQKSTFDWDERWLETLDQGDL